MQCKSSPARAAQPAKEAASCSAKRPELGRHHGISHGELCVEAWDGTCVLEMPSADMQVNPNAIMVSKRQEGNPVLKHIRNVRWQYADIIPDYQIGQQTCALFLSLRWIPWAVDALPAALVAKALRCCAVQLSRQQANGGSHHDSCTRNSIQHPSIRLWLQS